MKHLGIAIAAAVAVAASAAAASAQPSGATGFGSAPGGEVPILFNDRHVYAKPDRLKQGRVLAALVRGNEILVPLRSMFEQMGASVSYDSGTKTADVSKPGSDIKVTVGRPEVIINGDSRPLDVPPEIYKGAVVVPVRVIAESMGAYVQWVPAARVVVVRYIAAAAPPPPTTPPPAPATAPPTPAPAAPPLIAPPAAAPTAASKSPNKEAFIVGDYIADPNVYNQFASGNSVATWGPSYAGRAAIEFSLNGVPFMAEGYGEQYAYTHPGAAGIPRNAPCTGALAGNQACVTTIGGRGNVWVPQFQVIDGDVSARLGVKVANPRVYAAAAYLVTSNNYGYPRMHGFGFGVEKLPDLDRLISLFGSYYYYPEIEGGFTDPTSGAQYLLQYRFQQYQAGVTYNVPFAAFKKGGVFIEAGFMGNQSINKQFLPANGHEAGGFGGIGIHF